MHVRFLTNAVLWCLATPIVFATGVAVAQFDLPGRGDSRVQSAGDVSSVRLLSDKSAVSAGDTFNLVILFETQPSWHIYWKNPGEGAAAPDLRITAPDGFEIGDVRWPRPKVVESPIGDLYCLDGRTALFVPITAPKSLADGEALFTVNAGYAVCDSRKCFFGRASLDVSIETSMTPRGSISVPEASLIERHRKRLAKLVTDVDDASAEIVGEGETRRLIVTGPAHSLNRATFFPYGSPGIRYSNFEIVFENDRFTATVELTVNRANITRGAPNVGGLIALGTSRDDPGYEVDVPIESTTEAAAR